MSTMMIRGAKGLVVVLGCVSAMSAAARPFESKPYVGVSVSMLEYSQDESPTFDSVGITGKFGYRFNPAIAVEGRFGAGVEEDDLSVGSIDVETRLSNYIGGYLVLGYDNPNPVYPYAFAGVTHAKVDFEAYDAATGDLIAKDSETDMAFSYGVGANFVVSRNTAVTFDYSWYLNKDRFDLEGASLGLVFQY